MKILFLAARFPYPPLKGDQVRGYHQIRLLAERHTITLVSFAGGKQGADTRRAIEALGVEVITVPSNYLAMARGVSGGLLSPYPLQTLLYQSALMRRVLGARLEQGDYDLAHVQLARMAPYLERQMQLPRLIDLIDALSLNMERRYKSDRSPARFAAFFEWQRLRRYEQTICRSYDQVVVVSAFDRDAIGPFPNLQVIPIGVDLTSFPLGQTDRDPFTIVFSGNMGYYPNIQAARWFVNDVLPLVRAGEPRTKLMIVGAHPHSSVQTLAQEPGVVVTGFVPRVQPYLAGAAVAVVPMRAGSGMQFKVIEAMACGTPVVVTPFALGGLDVVDGEHLLVGATAQTFAAAVLDLLQDPVRWGQLATNGRALVEARYTWERTVQSLDLLYSRAVTAHG